MPLCSKLSRLLGWMNPPADPNRRPSFGNGLAASVTVPASQVSNPVAPYNLCLIQHRGRASMLAHGSKVTLHPFQVTA